MQMRRIAIFWEYFQAYHWSRVEGLIGLAKTIGCEVLAVALAEGAADCHIAAQSGDLRGVVRVLVGGTVPRPSNDSHVRRLLLELLDREQPDVVVIPGYVGCVVRAAVGWCRRNGRGAVLCSDSQEIDVPRHWLKEWVKRRLVARYDAGFASGTRAKAYLQKLGLPGDRIVTGYDAVDNAFFAQRAASVQAEATTWRSRLGLPKRYLLAVGRMIPKKGFPFLIRTYGRYVETERAAGRLPWGLVIIGDGPERATIEAERLRLPDPELVVLPGYLMTEQASVYFGLASVFVMPSLFEEQWGLVVNEAMAAGLPVLASEICGATPDLVVEGRTGFSFPPGDELRLAERMIWCSERADQMPVLGAAARAQVEAFDLENYSLQTVRAAAMAAEAARSRSAYSRWF